MNGADADFDYQKAAEFIRRKAERRRIEIHERFQQAWKDFDAIVTMIIEKYAPKRIYQWGSLLNEAHFSEISDIDIALEGVPSAEIFFKILGDADQLTSFDVDLVEIDKIDPIHAESIRKKGRLAYERKDAD